MAARGEDSMDPTDSWGRGVGRAISYMEGCWRGLGTGARGRRAVVFQALTTSLTFPPFLGSCGASQAGEAALGKMKQEAEEWSLRRAQGQGGGEERAQEPLDSPFPKCPTRPRAARCTVSVVTSDFCDFSVCL